MFLGIVVYLRLWTIDYIVSSDETELIRRQFDLANREAMDESAEWRLKYDVEAERSTKCMSELKQMKGSLEEDGNAAKVNLKLATLQKENIALSEQNEALKQDLEVEKLKCACSSILIMIGLFLYTSKKLFPELALSFCKVTASFDAKGSKYRRIVGFDFLKAQLSA